MHRLLILNKFNIDVVGGVESVVRDYARYNDIGVTWIASPDGNQ